MGKARVMIVDDEMDFAETLRERLALRGYDAIAAAGAEQAIAFIEGGWAPDVVLLDLKMPGIDGMETLGLIKQHSPSIEVIIVTGHGSTSSGIDGMQRGLFDYLMKPVDIDYLVRRIEEAIRHRR